MSVSLIGAYNRLNEGGADHGDLIDILSRKQNIQVPREYWYKLFDHTVVQLPSGRKLQIGDPLRQLPQILGLCGNYPCLILGFNRRPDEFESTVPGVPRRPTRLPTYELSEPESESYRRSPPRRRYEYQSSSQGSYQSPSQSPIQSSSQSQIRSSPQSPRWTSNTWF